MRIQGRFIDNLGKIYGLYTGGFMIFIILMAILEQFGVQRDTIGILFVAFTVVIYALIGWLSRTMQVEAYYVAGREVPAGLQRHGDGGGLDVRRLLRGHGRRHLLRRLRLHRLRRRLDRRLRAGECADGALPAQVRLLHGAGLHRHPLRRQPRALLRGVVLVVASFTYVTAQINASGTIAARALHIPFEVGVWIGLLGILLCSMLGGMRAVTWTQVAQYIVLIIAYLVPVFWMSNVQGFGVIPHFTYGEAVARIAELEPLLGLGTMRRPGGSGSQHPDDATQRPVGRHGRAGSSSPWRSA
jgi:cation/acetate symporter